MAMVAEEDAAGVVPTPLHFASTRKVVSFLIASGASTTIKDDFGRLAVDPEGETP
jgi:hypothetical protein